MVNFLPIALVAFGERSDTNKTKDGPQPRTGRGCSRHQTFELLEPEASLSRALIELDPRHAPVP